ncbi:TPA: hypothetical protein RQL08_004385 [Vibrio vulnificus]|uniref:hypothetical protein n=1 Tax=Vibrio TaxID=662 RepID=UPI0009B7FBDB|nr:hypothetical protein [Vibrio cholerae]MCU8352580.1 hypothetical protein [Vibrio vulnificus]TOG45099.1 hypothetical protein CGJ00_23675 [Vibrio parahaemolyticus]EGR0558347.1 hypothetical protein [Vibrio cholerae]EHB5529372.1 hypothetical protein [Vibrio cholerae]EHE6949654.1 hypothetical protein [Vibrio cholerae]
MVKRKNVPYGSDVSAGTYKCSDCGKIYSNQSKTSLPPCPNFSKTPHPLRAWDILTGQGDATKDPYP